LPEVTPVQKLNSTADRLRFLLVTSGGLGLSPVVPGTVGTAGGVVLALLLQVALEGTALTVALWAVSLVLLLIGCRMTAFVGRAFAGKDPGPFVLDEVVGYLIAVALYTTLRGPPDAVGHALCFFLFRVFDILKIQPAKRLEELPGAVGIMLDDVAAGLYAGIGVLVLHPLIAT